MVFKMSSPPRDALLSSAELCHVYLNCFTALGGAKQTGEWKSPLLKINTGEKLRSEERRCHTCSHKETKLLSQSMSRVLLPAGNMSGQTLVKLFVFLQACTLHVRSGGWVALHSVRLQSPALPGSPCAGMLHVGLPLPTLPVTVKSWIYMIRDHSIVFTSHKPSGARMQLLGSCNEATFRELL